MQVFFALLRFDIPLNAQIEYRGTIFIIFRFDKFRLNNEHYIIRSCAFQTNCSHFGYFTEIQLIIISIVVQILVEEQNGYSVRIYNDIKKKHTHHFTRLLYKYTVRIVIDFGEHMPNIQNTKAHKNSNVTIIMGCRVCVSRNCCYANGENRRNW